MEKMDRRAASKIIALGLLSPLFLKADGTPEIETPSANYELLRNKDGSMNIASKKDELRFKVGKNAFLLRPNSQIRLETSNITIKSMKLITGGVMGVFAPGNKTIEARTFTAGIRGTGIYLEEKDNDAVYCCLCYGIADYTDMSGKALLSLNSRYHDKPVIITQDKSQNTKMYDDKTHNHDDDELRVLEKMCGREPTFEEWLMMQNMLNPQSAY